MSMEVKVRTNGDDFASFEHDQVLVEFTKDGDSPNCPRSWTWSLWFDGNLLDGSVDEASLATSVKEATAGISEAIRVLDVIRGYLVAYGAFGKEPGE